MSKAEKYRRQDIAIAGMEMGMTIKLAAAYCGVTETIMRNWKFGDKKFGARVEKASADYALKLLPEAAKKEPFKMLQAVTGEYAVAPDTAIQVNVDARPLSAAPSDILLAQLKLLEKKTGE